MAADVFPGTANGLIRRSEIQALVLLLVVLTEKGSFSLGGVIEIGKVKMKEEESVQLGRMKRNNEVYEFNLNEQVPLPARKNRDGRRATRAWDPLVA